MAPNGNKRAALSRSFFGLHFVTRLEFIVTKKESGFVCVVIAATRYPDVCDLSIRDFR